MEVDPRDTIVIDTPAKGVRSAGATINISEPHQLGSSTEKAKNLHEVRKIARNKTSNSPSQSNLKFDDQHGQRRNSKKVTHSPRKVHAPGADEEVRRETERSLSPGASTRAA